MHTQFTLHIPDHFSQRKSAMSPSLLAAGAAALLALTSCVEASYLKYSTVPDYFLQDAKSTAAQGFNYVRHMRRIVGFVACL